MRYTLVRRPTLDCLAILPAEAVLDATAAAISLQLPSRACDAAAGPTQARSRADFATSELFVSGRLRLLGGA